MPHKHVIGKRLIEVKPHWIIVSDKDHIVSDIFWLELFSCLGTQLAHNSSYHPQYDGKNERVEFFF